MINKRIIPVLLLKDSSLVKTTNFKNPRYIGDPINTVRIFNEYEVDELIVLDIKSNKYGNEPNFKILKELANECFLPITYGGGINDFITATKIFEMGFEKISINSSAHDNPNLISQLSKSFGSQSIIGSIDVKQNFLNRYKVYSHSGRKNTKKDPVTWAKKLEDLGVGEIMVTSINKEGTWEGCDLELISKISNNVRIPVIAHGGVGSINHLEEILTKTSVNAVGIGNMVVYQNKGMGVLINVPFNPRELVQIRNST